MIQIVTKRRALKRFIHFTADLYRSDPFYVQPFFNFLEKELGELVLKHKTYIALLSMDGEVVRGRLLYTFDSSKDQLRPTAYFSFFDAIDDELVAKELFSSMEDDMRKNGIVYAEGTFAPYDPDTRRGILIDGFGLDPVIFASYNYPYYGRLIESAGYTKAYDTFSLKVNVDAQSEKTLKTISQLVARRHDIRIDPIDFHYIDRDINDIHTVFKNATSERNYQDAPSIELIANVAKNMRFFLDPLLVRIARENVTNEPVGFALAILDYNQLFRQTKGKFRPLWLLLNKRRITRVRGMLQYVVPKYQGSGLIGAIYAKIYEQFASLGITALEAGTMMEANLKPMTAFNKLGGVVEKTYRIYGKELSHGL